MNKEKIIFEIDTNLKDFYFSFKKGDNSNVFENEFIHSIQSLWPSFTFIKDNKQPLTNILNSLKKEENVSKNWIFDENFAKKHEKVLKNNHFFPIKSWERMYLNTKEMFSIAHKDNCSFEKLALTDLESFVKIINASVFHKTVLSLDTLKVAFENPNFSFYVVKYQNKLVSTCVIFNNGTTNGLYFIATKTVFRGNGFANNLVKYAINQQQKVNNNPFVLHATKMGKGIYSSLGFNPYSKLIIFVKI